jgi:hypothetical protein
MIGRLASALTCLALIPAMVGAQPARPDGNVELSGGIRWTGSMNVGGTDATETAPNGNRFSLFAAGTTLPPAAVFDGGVSVRVTRSFRVGLAASFGGVDLRTRIESDVEGIPGVDVVEQLTQLTIGVNVAFELARFAPSDRIIPFISGGAGYLRQLHDGRTLVETGSAYHVGGGADMLLQSGGRGVMKSVGIRVDVRGELRRGGVAFDDGMHAAPSAGLQVFVRF